MMRLQNKVMGRAALKLARWMIMTLIWLQTTTAALRVDSTALATTERASTPKAALIFLHGLGNSPRTCRPLIQDRLTELDPALVSKMKFIFPSAPRLCSTINGGQCLPCWFDLKDWPVGVSVRDDHKGIRQAVRQIEREVAQLEAEGIPKSRIIVGGFSQGACLALETVYSSKERYAGCIALSGWLALRGDLNCTPKACRTPLFWGHGQFDESVRSEQQFFGIRKLLQQGVQSATAVTYNMGHGVIQQELCDVADFIRCVAGIEQMDGRATAGVEVREKVPAETR